MSRVNSFGVQGIGVETQLMLFTRWKLFRICLVAIHLDSVLKVRRIFEVSKGVNKQTPF